MVVSFLVVGVREPEMNNNPVALQPVLKGVHYTGISK